MCVRKLYCPNIEFFRVPSYAYCSFCHEHEHQIIILAFVNETTYLMYMCKIRYSILYCSKKSNDLWSLATPFVIIWIYQGNITPYEPQQRSIFYYFVKKWYIVHCISEMPIIYDTLYLGNWSTNSYYIYSSKKIRSSTR